MFKLFLLLCILVLNIFIEPTETCQNSYDCLTKLTNSLTSNKCDEFEQFIQCVDENLEYSYNNHDRLFQFCSSTCPVFSICNKIRDKNHVIGRIIFATFIISIIILLFMIFVTSSIYDFFKNTLIHTNQT